MVLRSQSRILILPQTAGDIEMEVKDEVVSFRREDNKSLLLVMTREEVLQLAKEFYPSFGDPNL